MAAKKTVSARYLTDDSVRKLVDMIEKSAESLVLKCGNKKIARAAQRVYSVAVDMGDMLTTEETPADAEK